MNDQNRYEEVPQKENKFAKAMKAFGHYWKFVFIDFFNSFKYNNMKLAAILFAMPGILLGFFMFAHVPTIRNVTVSYNINEEGTNVDIKAALNTDTTDIDTDYVLTVAKYEINGKTYENIQMQLDSSIDEKNINTYPVDSPEETGKTQLSIPNCTLVQKETEDDDGNITQDANAYNIVFGGLTATELENVQCFYVFLYETVDGVDYYLGNAHYFEVDADSFSINTLGKGTYKLKIKAIAKGDNYSSSKISDLIPFTVIKEGSKYDAHNTEFVKFAGKYDVMNAGDDDNLKNFSIEIKNDGAVVYKTSEKSTDAQLFGSGTDLYSANILKVNILPFDFSGIAIFFLTLVGFLNVFLALELSKKKNLGTVIKCSLTTAAIVLLGAAYVYAIVATNSHLGEGKLTINNQKTNEPLTTLFDTNAIISIITVCGAALFSVVGLILAFINYDRTYEKVDR